MENRSYDKKLDLLVQQIGEMQQDIADIKMKQQELGQRQMDLTIPKLVRIEKCLFGNGVTGLMGEHIECMGRQKIYDKVVDKISGVIMTLIVMGLSFSTAYAVMYFKVDILWKALGK